MAVNLTMRDDIMRAVNNSFYYDKQKLHNFIGKLPEDKAVRVVARSDKQISGDLVALAEKVVIADDSDHSPSDDYLGLQRFKEYGANVLRAVIRRICEVDIHGHSAREARNYAANLSAAA